MNENSIEGIFTDLGSAVRKEITWIVKDFIPSGLVVIGGPPKEAQKSTIAMAIAGLVSGLPVQVFPPHMSQVPELGTVLVMSYEAEAGELAQMAEDGLHVKVPADERILVADDPWRWRLDDEECVEELLALAREREPLVMILDPLRDCHDQDENDSAAMVRMLRPLQRWAKEAGAACIILHHTVKGGEDMDSFKAKHLRGTGAIFGKADALLMITPRADGAITIEATYKRAKAWTRTIQLATWDRANPAEVITSKDRQVLALIQAGVERKHLARESHFGGATITESIERLTRNGLL